MLLLLLISYITAAVADSGDANTAVAADANSDKADITAEATDTDTTVAGAAPVADTIADVDVVPSIFVGISTNVSD